MAGRQTIPAQIARDGKEVGELWPHIAAHTGDGGAPGQIIIGKLFDHRLTKSADMVDNMVNKAQPLRDLRRIANILPRAAGTRAARRAIAVIQAQRYADDICARTRGKRCNHARIDAARHGNDNPPAGQIGTQLKICLHGAAP